MMNGHKLSEKKATKLSEFSLNFPKLADWLCMGWSVCQAAAKAGNEEYSFQLFVVVLYACSV